jgi:tRNA(His) 5'-end guanylyltransferase
LRRQGKNATEATEIMDGLSVSAKNELLFQQGINFNDLPNWQKRGIGLYWKSVAKIGYNPITEEQVLATRQQIYRDFNLPMKDEYSQFIDKLIHLSSRIPLPLNLKG